MRLFSFSFNAVAVIVVLCPLFSTLRRKIGALTTTVDDSEAICGVYLAFRLKVGTPLGEMVLLIERADESEATWMTVQ